MLASLTKVVNLLAAGNRPAFLAPWTYFATITALIKTSAGIRTTAVDEMLRRLVGSCFMSRVTDSEQLHFQPLQIVLPTSGGTEIVVHATLRVYRHFKNAASHAMLTIDLTNALNLVSHGLFLERVEASFSDLSRVYVFDGAGLLVVQRARH